MSPSALTGKTGMSVYFLCACIAFVFVTVSTPIAQFKGKGFVPGPTVNITKLSCVTLWGMKLDCSENPYVMRPADFSCETNRFQNLFRAGEAFAIISIFFTLLSCVACGLTFNGTMSKIPTIITALICVVTIVIPWACMAGVRHGNFCGTAFHDDWRSNWQYSAGFALFVAAWCIQIVGTVALIVL